MHPQGGHVPNYRVVSTDAGTVVFRWEDYRIERGDRQKVMRLASPGFIRRFLVHVLPDRLHRIRHYDRLASATRKTDIARIRGLPGHRPTDQNTPKSAETAPLTLRGPCPCCGGPMRIDEIFRRRQKP